MMVFYFIFVCVNLRVSVVSACKIQRIAEGGIMGEHKHTKGVCSVCGWKDDRANLGGRTWASPGLCSACAAAALDPKKENLQRRCFLAGCPRLIFVRILKIFLLFLRIVVFPLGCLWLAGSKLRYEVYRKYPGR